MAFGEFSLDTLLSQVFGQAAAQVTTSDPETTVAIRILGRVQAHVFGRWRMAQRQGLGCELHFAPPGQPAARCRQPMIGLCSVCQRPVCLSHAAVHLETGTPLCFGCIELARSVTAQGHRSASAPPQADEQERTKLRRKHLRRLRLKGHPTEAEILAAFKRLAARAHPDRQPPGQQAVATKRFKALGQSRDWLLSELKAQAA